MLGSDYKMLFFGDKIVILPLTYWYATGNEEKSLTLGAVNLRVERRLAHAAWPRAVTKLEKNNFIAAVF